MKSTPLPVCGYKKATVVYGGYLQRCRISWTFIPASGSFSGSWNKAGKHVFCEILQSVREGRDIGCSARDAVAVWKVIETIYQQ